MMMPLCLLAIVLLLIWQFDSFRRTGIIVLSIPLILLGLFWCWKSHSSPTLMPQPATEAAK